MLNLAEYRRKETRLADYLPWACLVAPGVVPGGTRLPGSPAPQAYGRLLTDAGTSTAAPGQPGYVRPGAPPNARLVDLLRSLNDGTAPSPAPSPIRKPPPNDDEP